MDLIKQNLKTLRRLNRFFIILGLLEIFIFVFLFQNFFTMILGLLTIIPANIALDEKKFKWNYFVGAWTLIKYNPITILAILGFISGYFSYIIDIVSINTSDKLIGILFIICFILIAVTAFVLGILIIIKTERQIKLRKSQSIFD